MHSLLCSSFPSLLTAPNGLNISATDFPCVAQRSNVSITPVTKVGRRLSYSNCNNFGSFSAFRAPLHPRLCRKQVLQVSSKLVLEQAGDGDVSHLDAAIPIPGDIPLVNDIASVGREAEKADIVIPVPTVSGRHATLETKGKSVIITDLDSTNGTYVGNRKLRAGSPFEASLGTYIIFGDEHLAKFRLVEAEEEKSEEVNEVA